MDICNRTRSKRLDQPFMSLPDGSSSGASKSKRGRSSLVIERRKRRARMEKRVGETDVICIEESSCEGEAVSVSSSESESDSGRGKKEVERSTSGVVFMGESVDRKWELGSVHDGKRKRESLMMIEINDTDDDDSGSQERLVHSEKKGFQALVHVKEEEKSEEGYVFGNDKGEKFGNDEGLEHSQEKGFEGFVDDKEGEKSEEDRGSYAFADKGENFGNEDCGWGPANPITIDSDRGCDSEEERGSAGDDIWSSSTDSEYVETSDEDFLIDEDENEILSSEESSSSSDDEKEKEWRRYSKERVRKVETESSGICRKSGERKYKQVEEEEVELENTPSSVNNDECGVQDQEEWKDVDKDTETETSNELMMKGCSSKLSQEEDNKEAKKHEAKRVERRVKNVSDDVEGFGDYQKSLGRCRPSEDESQEEKKKQANDSVNLDGYKGKGHHEKGTSVRKVSSLLRNQEKVGDSAKHKTMENKERDHKDETGYRNELREKKPWVVDNKTGYRDELHKVLRMSSKRKEQRLIELLAECLSGMYNSVKGDSYGLEEKNDDVYQLETQPPACGEAQPLQWKELREVQPPLERTESEKELDMLWKEMNEALEFEEIASRVGNIGINEEIQNTGSSTFICEHDFYLDEQIGVYCKYCYYIATEIKYVSPPVIDRFPLEGLRKTVSSGGEKVSLFEINNSGSDSEATFIHNEGTAWDLIPNIKETLYPHQQEGFEFIWTNLTGSIDLHKSKRVDSCSVGGCIISHAPGTGKTRLTMVFLQAYLKVFPKCRPVIIAPASLLLTWEDEFKKWDIGIPFHNLNNLELSGKEHINATNIVDWSRNPQLNKNGVRMVKFCSWLQEKSILGISYHMYEKLAGGKSKADLENKKTGKGKIEKKHVSVKVENTKSGMMGKALRDAPGLLVLDEGHTPRNQRSLIFKVLSEIQTKKRIILSGTPFQNNFLELYNTLCLAVPSFPETIPHELKKFCQSRLMQEKKAPKDGTCETDCSGNITGNPVDKIINQLKLLMDPFVHVHKGSILQKHLPGLRDCVLTLKPDSLQNGILESIECSQNTLNFDHKLALVSIHPSLFLCCSLSEKEECVVDKDLLEKHRLNPYVGVKTRFLVEFIRLCEAVNEKVLVFSQFIDPLRLIIDQLKAVFNWYEGKEVFCMYGKVDQKQKQSLIHRFNDANSQVKILLASTKACSEGISLVGASRVVLLDVVWNPSVERQAISRAYRLGQKRVVYTYHLLTQGTTECTKFCKQAEKDRLSELVFSAKNAENDEPESCAGNFEDKVLDQMVRHDKLKDMFGECLVQPKERNMFESFGS